MEIKIAERIKELMTEQGLKTEQGLNQVRLAAKIGVKQNTVSAWVLGKKEPCISSLWALADFFNTTIDYLVGRQDY